MGTLFAASLFALAGVLSLSQNGLGSPSPAQSSTAKQAVAQKQANEKDAEKDSPAVLALVVWMTTAPTADEQGKFAKYQGMSLVPDRAMLARQSPDTNAKSTWTIQPLELTAIFDVTQGWTRVGSGTRRGWIQMTEKDLHFVIRRDLRAAANVIGDVHRFPWQIAIRHAIIQGKPLIGFTQQQVELALGRPLRTSEEETAAGTVTTLIYPDRVVEMKNSKVSKITTIK